MKYIYKYLIVTFLCISVFSCQDQTEIYNEFAKEHVGKIYPGKVIDPIAHSGKNRVKIQVTTPGDPSVKNIKVFWNFYKDSITLISSGINTNMETIIDLPESSYSFIIKTYDENGNVSVPTEIFGTSYGDDYQNRISNREVINKTDDSMGNLTLEFTQSDISNGAVETLITYVNLSDEESTIVLDASLDTIEITDYKLGGQYYTVYKPDATSIDTFITGTKSI
ncbi:DUF4998 domain-containing protein [Wenyingzhuangia sp. IMCC45467]